MKGFTLIELIVSITLIMIVTGYIIANYNNFSENQQIKQTALNFKSNIRFAQTNAFSAYKPASGDCVTSPLDGYVMTFAAGGYTIQPECNSTLQNVNKTTVTYHNGITLTTAPNTTSLLFKVLTKGISIPNFVQFTFSSPQAAHSYEVDVYPNGNVVDVGFTP
jgi:prepilin-type N-terminal cleavage/methylation domain-containing protein